MKTDSKRRFFFFLAYTGIFVMLAGAFYMIFASQGKALISRFDGWRQHYKAMIYYARYLRSIFENLLAGNGLVIPEWGFALGEGNDILQTLHYYVIGDPFAFFSFLVPESLMYHYYNAMLLLRMYLAGLSFAFFCSVTGKKDFCGELVGSVAYALCFWTIKNFSLHPYFLNPLIYFPLLIAGVEKILKGGRPYFFTCVVCIAALSNFYYFYMLVLLTVLYAVVRYLALLVSHSAEVKKLLCLAGKTVLSSAIGVCMAAVILLPVCTAVLGDNRVGASYIFHLFYSPSYYLELPTRLISSMNMDYWLLLGYTPVMLFVIFLLFSDRENGILKVFFLIGVLFICVPFFGKALNGGSYITNRWCWAFTMLNCYLLVIYWQRIIHPDKKTAVRLAVFLGIYAGVCFCTQLIHSLVVTTWKLRVWGSLLFAAGFLGFVYAAGKRHTKLLTERIVSIVCVLAVFANIYLEFLPRLQEQCEEALTVSELDTEDNEAFVVKQIADEEYVQDFYRYSGSELTKNAGVLANVSNTSYFWSIANSSVVEFRDQLELADLRSYEYDGHGGRAILETLDSVLYYAIPNEDEQSTAPYGFSYLDTVSSRGKTKYKIFRNNNYLSVGYGYKHYVSYEEWSRLNPAEKEEAMLQGIVLDKYDGNVSEIQPEFESEIIPVERIDLLEGVTQEGDYYVVSEGVGDIILTAQGDGSAEYFIRFSDIDCQPLIPSKWNQAMYRISALPSFAGWTNFTYSTPEYPGYSGRKNLTMSFSYCDDYLSEVRIELKPGRYHFGNIEIIRRPMERYEDEAYELYENSLTDVQIGTDTVSGKITADEPMMMCFSIPYASGWKATVDGKEAKIWKANVKNMAVEVGAGEHEIRLTYSCPWKKEGMILSAIGLFAFAVLILAEERKRRMRQ